jgi:WD40 repeat protein
VVPPPRDGRLLLLVRGNKGQLQVWDEESGELHREFQGFTEATIGSLTFFLSPDGQQPRLVAGSRFGQLRIYDPETGSVLQSLRGHTGMMTDLACIASPSAAPHHPRVVSGSDAGTAKVWDGETGERLADLRNEVPVSSVAVWKEHTGGHDRIATTGGDGRIKVWDGEALTLLHDLDCAGGSASRRIRAFTSAEGPARLLVALAADLGVQVWDPEEGRLLHDGINRRCPMEDCHLFESAQGRYLLAIVGSGARHARHPGDTYRPFLDVWDLGEAPAATGHMRGAHKQG